MEYTNLFSGCAERSANEVIDVLELLNKCSSLWVHLKTKWVIRSKQDGRPELVFCLQHRFCSISNSTYELTVISMSD